jgi:hypothetical protein
MALKDILTPHRVHLLAGVSDAGKTRFLIPILMTTPGLPPWVYVVGDRTVEDANDTISDMGFNPATVPMLPAFGAHNKETWLEIVIALERQFPKAELIVVEGFQDLCDGQGKAREIRNFLSDVSAHLPASKAHPNGLTVLGVVESPKMKPHEKYSNPRQRVSGFSGWGYHGSTIMLIEDAAKDEQFLTPNRLMWVCTKGNIRRKIEGCFDGQNRLIFPTL